jgi:hypothetical protein
MQAKNQLISRLTLIPEVSFHGKTAKSVTNKLFFKNRLII